MLPRQLRLLDIMRIQPWRPMKRWQVITQTQIQVFQTLPTSIFKRMMGHPYPYLEIARSIQ